MSTSRIDDGLQNNHASTADKQVEEVITTPAGPIYKAAAPNKMVVMSSGLLACENLFEIVFFDPKIDADKNGFTNSVTRYGTGPGMLDLLPLSNNRLVMLGSDGIEMLTLEQKADKKKKKYEVQSDVVWPAQLPGNEKGEYYAAGQLAALPNGNFVALYTAKLDYFQDAGVYTLLLPRAGNEGAAHFEFKLDIPYVKNAALGLVVPSATQVVILDHRKDEHQNGLRAYLYDLTNINKPPEIRYLPLPDYRYEGSFFDMHSNHGWQVAFTYIPKETYPDQELTKVVWDIKNQEAFIFHEIIKSKTKKYLMGSPTPCKQIFLPDGSLISADRNTREIIRYNTHFDVIEKVKVPDYVQSYQQKLNLEVAEIKRLAAVPNEKLSNKVQRWVDKIKKTIKHVVSPDKMLYAHGVKHDGDTLTNLSLRSFAYQHPTLYIGFGKNDVDLGYTFTEDGLVLREEYERELVQNIKGVPEALVKDIISGYLGFFTRPKSTDQINPLPENVQRIDLSEKRCESPAPSV